MQSTERPSDFKKDPIKDLLDTNSLGVHLEDKDFHKRIPKIEIEESPDDEATKPNVTPKPRTTPRIIRGNNPNNAVVGLSPAPKISSVFDALDNIIKYGRNAISGLISDLTKEPVTKPNETTKHNAKPSQDTSGEKIPVENSIFHEKGKTALFQAEKYKSKPYDDQKGTDTTKYVKGATIGYGHKIQSPEEFAEIQKKYPNGMTQEEAIDLFNKDLPKYENIVKKNLEGVKLTQNEYDALVIRAYNCGEGGFTYNNTHAKEMTDYIKSGKDTNSEEFARLYQGQRFSQGKYMRGVEKRRIIELDIFQKNDYQEHKDMQYSWKRLKYDKLPKK